MFMHHLIFASEVLRGYVGLDECILTTQVSCQSLQQVMNFIHFITVGGLSSNESLELLVDVLQLCPDYLPLPS